MTSRKQRGRANQTLQISNYFITCGRELMKVDKSLGGGESAGEEKLRYLSTWRWMNMSGNHRQKPEYSVMTPLPRRLEIFFAVRVRYRGNAYPIPAAVAAAALSWMVWILRKRPRWGSMCEKISIPWILNNERGTVVGITEGRIFAEIAWLQI